MASTSAAVELSVWTDGARAGLMGDVVDLLGGAVTPVAVGGPRVAEVDALARRLDCRRDDDLRKMLIERPPAVLLLASLEGATATELSIAVDQRASVVAIEPAAASTDELDTLSEVGEGPVVVTAPAFLAAPGWTKAADPRESLGPPRTLQFDTCGTVGGPSLFARLFDAWQTLLHFVDLPQSVDAALHGVGVDLPRDLRAMRGRLTAHARVADGASAVLHAADAAAVDRRRLHVIGDKAELLVRDADYALHDIDGRLIDEHVPERPRTALPDLIAAQARRLIERRGDPGPSSNLDAAALACCQACLLSARTGAPEDPQKLLQLRR